MQAKIYSVDGKEIGKTELPEQFEEEYRPDLIRRAVLAIKSHNIRPRATDVYAGQKNTAYLSKRRREYKATYGYGRSRAPRKVMSRMGSRFDYKGANVPFAVGGRVAHPPKIEKVWAEKINAKERRKAIRSAIAATTDKKIVFSRGHKLGKIDLPIVVEGKIEEFPKSVQAKKLLAGFGLTDELKRAKEKKVRAGKGKRRGRKYKKKVGPLFVVSKKCNLLKSAKNIAGSDVVLVKDLNAELLAPGTKAGRLVVWSALAVEQMKEKKMFV